jgi:hypothetical protein
MATKNYTFPSDSSGGNDYQPDLTDTADISVAFADFVEGVQTVFNSVGSDVSFIDNKLDGTTDLSIPASRFILQGTQSANNIKFAVTNTGSITLNLPPATTTIVGTDSSQTLTNKTLSTATISGTTTLTGTVDASGATVNSPTISNPTISGSVNGNQDFNNNVNVDGTLTVGLSATVSGPATVTGKLTAGETEVSSLKVNGFQIESGYIPLPGMVVMYTGTTAPVGWAICNGTNGTPDLRDRFIIGAGSTFNINATGGGYGTGGAGDHGHNLTAHSHYSDHSHYADHSHSVNPGATTTTSDSHSHNTGGASSTFSFKFASGSLNTGTIAGAHTHGTNSDSHSHTVNIATFNSGNANGAGITTGTSNYGNTAGANANTTSSSPGNHTHTTDRPLFYALMYIMKL